MSSLRSPCQTRSCLTDYHTLDSSLCSVPAPASLSQWAELQGLGWGGAWVGPRRSTSAAAASSQCWLGSAWGMEAASLSPRRQQPPPPPGCGCSSGVSAGDTGWSPTVSKGRWCSFPPRLLSWASPELLSSLGPTEPLVLAELRNRTVNTDLQG